MELESASVSILGKTLTIYGESTDHYFIDYRTKRKYEDEVVDAIKLIVRNDFVSVDIGANIGLSAILMAMLSPKGKVYAFEPDPNSFSALSTNTAKNNMGNIVAVNLALSDKKGIYQFFTRSNFRAGNAILPDDSPLINAEYSGDLITVAADSLDNYLETIGIVRLDFMKIDVEGFEINVLKGCSKTLSQYRPIVLCEFNSYTFIRFQNVTPRDVLDYFYYVFDSIYCIDRDSGIIRIIENTEMEREKFLDNNLCRGFVDNLICCFDNNTIESIVKTHNQKISKSRMAWNRKFVRGFKFLLGSTSLQEMISRGYRLIRRA